MCSSIEKYYSGQFSFVFAAFMLSVRLLSYFASLHVAVCLIGKEMGMYVEILSPESLNDCLVVLTQLRTFDVRRSAVTLRYATANYWYKNFLHQNHHNHHHNHKGVTELDTLFSISSLNCLIVSSTAILLSSFRLVCTSTLVRGVRLSTFPEHDTSFLFHLHAWFFEFLYLCSK
jgi:hypothetical protein